MKLADADLVVADPPVLVRVAVAPDPASCAGVGHPDLEVVPDVLQVRVQQPLLPGWDGETRLGAGAEGTGHIEPNAYRARARRDAGAGAVRVAEADRVIQRDGVAVLADNLPAQATGVGRHRTDVPDVDDLPGFDARPRRRLRARR